jgi:dihydroneopterin aldolase
MKTKIAIRGAEFLAYHGYYKEEQKTGHTFLVDIEVNIFNVNLKNDQLEDTINYEKLYEICKEEMKLPRKLLETIAYSITETIKSRFNNVEGGKVVIQKMGPQLGGKVEKTVIEVEF